MLTLSSGFAQQEKIAPFVLWGVSDTIPIVM